MAADYKYGFDGMTRERMLEKMKKGWKSAETPCGTGSQIDNTVQVRKALSHITQKHDVKTVNDAGAGDMRWVGLTKWTVDYRPFDLFPRKQDVQQFDITKDVMPEADLILCRHVLNHLSPKLALDALENFKASGSRFLLMTNCKNQQKYWEDFGITVAEPISRHPDCQKWWLELHRLDTELYENRLHQVG